jgi:colanic acid/amylovoran biosynthesis protein
MNTGIMKLGDNSELNIGLLGASFDTGNLGVSALAESSIKIILHKWPNAKIYLLGSAYEPKEEKLSLAGRDIDIRNIPIRFSKNILLPYHFLQFVLYGFVIKMLPGKSLKRYWTKKNKYFKALYEMDLAFDITGGDSFSDIYGLRRFILGFLQKWLIIFIRKKLVFLQQTYGPFDKKITKALAGFILKRVDMIYSRDKESLAIVKSLLNGSVRSDKLKFVPDAAFVLDPRNPEHSEVDSLSGIRKKDSVVIGFNVSGLLYKGGYTQNNMFKLKSNYPDLVLKITEELLKDEKNLVLLIPHVFPPPGLEVESDSNACTDVYEKLYDRFPNRIFMVRGRYNHSEIKYIIGICDFFIGSRMHSCIAALSEMIPSIGLAYSKKFTGVFNSINAGQLVIDLREQSEEAIIKKINKIFAERDKIASDLRAMIPDIKNIVLNTLVALN